MKNFIKSSILLALATIISCKKETKKDVITNEVKKYVYQYKAFDGSVAEVTFTHYLDKSYILIARNSLKIELPQTKVDEKSATFEKDGIKAVTEGQKLTITQNGVTFELVKK